MTKTARPNRTIAPTATPISTRSWLCWAAVTVRRSNEAADGPASVRLLAAARRGLGDQQVDGTEQQREREQLLTRIAFP